MFAVWHHHPSCRHSIPERLVAATGSRGDPRRRQFTLRCVSARQPTESPSASTPNCNWHDTLSTAAHFSKLPEPPTPRIRESQRLQAERTAQSVDLKQALPLARPRALYPAVGLALALAGVLLMRYAVLGSFESA